jgi:hypothetical protein
VIRTKTFYIIIRCSVTFKAQSFIMHCFSIINFIENIVFFRLLKMTVFTIITITKNFGIDRLYRQCIFISESSLWVYHLNQAEQFRLLQKHPQNNPNFDFPHYRFYHDQRCQTFQNLNCLVNENAEEMNLVGFSRSNRVKINLVFLFFLLRIRGRTT